MTRDDLVKFLQSNYEPNEKLVWQTISYEDVANGVERATPDNWEEFIESLDTHNYPAEQFSENAFSAFYEFVEDLYKHPEEEEEVG
jgi:hypothetical protein